LYEAILGLLKNESNNKYLAKGYNNESEDYEEEEEEDEDSDNEGSMCYNKCYGTGSCHEHYNNDDKYNDLTLKTKDRQDEK